MSGANDGTTEGMFEFLEWAGRTGEMNASTARAWGAAARQVLSIEDDPDAVNLRDLDVDALLDRFENLNRTKYTRASMNTYRSRVRQAVSSYLLWLANEPWKPAARAARKSSNSAKERPEKVSSTVADAVVSPQHGQTPRLVNYTVPLRPELMVNITLPVDLTTADAERISTFVRSLAFSFDGPLSAEGLS